MKDLLIFGDALTYPGVEGISRHIMSLVNNLTAKQTTIRPTLVICDRGSIDKYILKKIKCRIVLVTPNTFYSYNKMKEILSKLHPDILQSCDSYQAMLIAARYSLEFKIPLLMEHHDIDDEFALNYNGSNVKRLNKSLQLSVCELASINRTLSSKDMSFLVREKINRKNTFINLPTFIDDEAVNIKHSIDSKSDVMFIGNCAYPPNREAFDFICNTLAPNMSEVNFHIIGRLTDSLDPNIRNVKTYGIMDNISKIASKVSYGISPLNSGSGLKIKVLTMLSFGLPVIGTPKTFEGYEKSISLIETTLDNFSKTLSKKISSYSLKEACEARYLFENKYSAKSTLKKLIKLYKNINFNIEQKTSENFKPIIRDDSYLVWLKEPKEINSEPVKKTVYINF